MDPRSLDETARQSAAAFAGSSGLPSRWARRCRRTWAASAWLRRSGAERRRPAPLAPGGRTATAVQDVTATLGVSGRVSSFGEDGCGELYLVQYGGEIRKIVPGP